MSNNLPVGDISIVINKVFPPKIRRYIYLGALICIAGLVIAGIITWDAATLWMLLAASILSVGTHSLVVANSPKEINKEGIEQ